MSAELRIPVGLAGAHCWRWPSTRHTLSGTADLGDEEGCAVAAGADSAAQADAFFSTAECRSAIAHQELHKVLKSCGHARQITHVYELTGGSEILEHWV